MAYGGIDFGHVWAFQIKCMMPANQYGTLIKALEKSDKALVITACLRLGWNDAFRHTSKNTDEKLSDTERAQKIFDACEKLVPYFEEYANLASTANRFKKMKELLEDKSFCDVFATVKEINHAEKPLCLGHIQKMFNIAMKLILCLLLSAEHAEKTQCNVVLGKTIENEEITLLNGGLLTFSNFPYKFDTADCPIDSIILGKIDNKTNTSLSPINGHSKYKEIVWSKLGAAEAAENYENTQKAITTILADPGKSNLYFDFENWNT